MLLGFGYSQCNESNWQEYYPEMQGCDLAWADLSYANLSGAFLHEANFYGANLAYVNLYEAYLNDANLDDACLEGAIGFTQTDYNGTPILEGCAGTGGDCSFEDTDADGYDDVSYGEGYDAGATSGDLNLDGFHNVLDIVTAIDMILNP